MERSYLQRLRAAQCSAHVAQALEGYVLVGVPGEDELREEAVAQAAAREADRARAVWTAPLHRHGPRDRRRVLTFARVRDDELRPARHRDRPLPVGFRHREVRHALLDEDFARIRGGLRHEPRRARPCLHELRGRRGQRLLVDVDLALRHVQRGDGSLRHHAGGKSPDRPDGGQRRHHCPRRVHGSQSPFNPRILHAVNDNILPFPIQIVKDLAPRQDLAPRPPRGRRPSARRACRASGGRRRRGARGTSSPPPRAPNRRRG